MIKYSIIIPTCNKSLVKECLNYLAKINRPKNDYEVLVVHNTTPDDIKSVTDEYQNKIPNLQYIKEEMYGLMDSRHRGAKEAQGEILCFLDDDSFVSKDWLVAIEKTFKNPCVVLAGGNNLPLYETIPPKWLKYFWNSTSYGRWLGQLSLIDFSRKNMILPAWFAFGCNLILRKNIFFEMGGTDPDTVPGDKQKFQGDGETALSLKLNKNGYVLHFNPEIEIYHFVPGGRMTLEYFQKRAFFQGVCDSFSKIRKDNGFDYYDFIPNSSIDKKRLFWIPEKFCNKCRNIIYKVTVKITKLTDLKNYNQYVYIKREHENAYVNGFYFHQNEVKNDPDLLKWVLNENYLE
jgi:GT2 family glycosyltransferase